MITTIFIKSPLAHLVPKLCDDRTLGTVGHLKIDMVRPSSLNLGDESNNRFYGVSELSFGCKKLTRTLQNIQLSERLDE